MKLCWIVFPMSAFIMARAFNGDLAELECPDDCDCHYFRINWVTDCSDSNLTVIPYNELSLNVYILDMNNNFITDVKPFPRDIKMRRLQIANNFMTEVRKESFQNLNYLIDSDFSGNRITRVEPDAFEDSPGLLTLELQDNPLAPVEGPFLNAKSLIYLDISSCGLKNLNPNFFSNLTTLSTLDLSSNPLVSITNEVFHPLTSLETLKMNDCNISHIANFAFSSKESLKTLELAGSNLIDIDWPTVLGQVNRLEYLNIRNSGISNLPEDTFNNSTFLRLLILAENKLLDFDIASTIGQKLSHLDTLDLSDCHLNRHLSEDAFSNATKLKTLYLSGNTLFASDLLVALAPLVKLQKLSLSNCGLSVLPDTFRIFTSLQELDISHNPLNDAFVKLITPLETLEYLNMGYSNLSYISPTTFSKMTSLKRLVLSGNNLNSLEAGLFGNLTRLESLELNFCDLRRPLNATLFFNNLTYTDLTELQLAGNPLRVSRTGPLLPKQFSRLRSLDLSNCNLTYLPQEAFYWTRNLTDLILTGNRFSLPDDLRFLELLPKLETLDLRYNNLSSFSPKDISVNSNVGKLKLIGNPWKCDCSVAELWDWANLEKGNLAILEGSTLEAQHMTVGKEKKKKLLVCNYDTKHPMPMVINKTTPGRRPFINPNRLLTATNRTWAKYVRESGCEQPANLNRPPRSVEIRSYEDELMSTAVHGPNTWATAAICAATLYGILMVVLGVSYYATRKQRYHATGFSQYDKDS